MGTLVKAEVRDTEENTREGITRRARKEDAGCIKAVAGNKKFLVQYYYVQKIQMSYVSLS